MGKCSDTVGLAQRSATSLQLVFTDARTHCLQEMESQVIYYINKYKIQHYPGLSATYKGK